MSRLCLCSVAVCWAAVSMGCAGAEAPGGAVQSMGTSTGSDATTIEASSTVTPTSSTSDDGADVSSTTSGSSSTGEPGSSSSTGGSSSSTGPACELGTLDCECADDTCEDGLVCADGVCEPPPNCPQEDSEPNNEEGQAPEFPQLNDFNPNLEFVDGRLPSADDVDWFSYRCNDTFGGQVDMNFEMDSPIPVRVCQYFECDVAQDPVVNCPEDSVADVSPEGLLGCCSDQTSATVSEIDCSPDDDDDSGRIFLRVDEPAVDMCVSYDLGYHC